MYYILLISYVNIMNLKIFEIYNYKYYSIINIIVPVALFLHFPHLIYR